MALDKTLKKVMIIGSGPIIIGQAAEFDYSGTQACKAIKEEGIETILVNSNPATIMTDSNIADKVYIEPLTIEALESIINTERPDGILAGFGGQTALNLAMELNEKGVLEKYAVRLLGIKSESIKKSEDRELFKKLMIEIGQPIPKSIIATNVDECIEFVNNYGYPVIIRPAYTLGGTGGGFAANEEELIKVCQSGISKSPIGQILLEQSVAGWKEIEYEVIRDGKDNCIIICNMENIDPVGVHTGDSIVVAPSQTLRDKEYQMLRKASIDIIRSLEIEGGCNVQFALDPKSENYIVIEVNPRVSRSSALASKATGYPIAKIASKIAVGYSLDELKNTVTGTSSACFEPALDYVALKIPKWPFDKFSKAERTLGTQMKATGEVMAISRNFESAILKAVVSLEGKVKGVRYEKLGIMSDEELVEKILKQDDERIFAICEALRRGMTKQYIHELTKIDLWFIDCFNNIVTTENQIKDSKLDSEIIKKAQSFGFTDAEICELSSIDYDQLKAFREENNIYPVYKMVDTCAGEFEAVTPYYYSCYDDEDENIIKDNKKIVVIGSGPIRIGQGIEFDYCCVHGVWAIKESGYEAIIINNNPETVSTDFDTSDKLYFEPLYIDDVMNVINEEKPEGVIVQFGGQTSLNLCEKLNDLGVNILGTSFDSIDLAEDRDRFRKFLEKLNIRQPKGISVCSLEEAEKAAITIGYPLVVRPSYVIGGRAMEIVYDNRGLTKYMNEAMSISTKPLILMDRYIRGTEVEVDAICDGKNILVPGVMEHVERTGVHSGDSISVYPPITLSKEVIEDLIKYTEKIAIGLKVKGLINIQYVYDGKDIHVIEVNPRASRTVPILSKVTDVPMVNLAVKVMLGQKLTDLGYGTGLLKNKNLYAVKMPVFSGEKLVNADVYLGPEMKSTGEVLGVDTEYDKALYKAFLGSGIKIVSNGGLYISLKDADKEEGVAIAKSYSELGFDIYASEGTAKYLVQNGLKCTHINLKEVNELISKEVVRLIINTPTRGNDLTTEGFSIRRKGAEYRVTIFTCLDTANVYKKALNLKNSKTHVEYKSLEKYL